MYTKFLLGIYRDVGIWQNNLKVEPIKMHYVIEISGGINSIGDRHLHSMRGIFLKR
jgi:hypothetical protein